MNCNDTERLISAERDGALTEKQRSALEAHIGSCGSCRQFRADLAASASAWKMANHSVSVPDGDREWFAIRRRIRQDEKPATIGFGVNRWFGIPVGVAAMLLVAIALAFFWTDSGLEPKGMDLAAAEYVEVEDDSASVVVFVDEESGWLVVWSLPESVETEG